MSSPVRCSGIHRTHPASRHLARQTHVTSRHDSASTTLPPLSHPIDLAQLQRRAAIVDRRTVSPAEPTPPPLRSTWRDQSSSPPEPSCRQRSFPPPRPLPNTERALPLRRPAFAILVITSRYRCPPRWSTAKRTRPRGSSPSTFPSPHHLHHVAPRNPSPAHPPLTAPANLSDHRCFGDKGDVEDITEGSSQSTESRHAELPFAPAARLVALPLVADQLGAPADIISTVEFDHTGNYLATGDKGGRVVLFERNETVRWSLACLPCPPPHRSLALRLP